MHLQKERFWDYLIRDHERGLLFGIVLLALLVRVCALLYFQAYEIKSEWAFGYETGQIAESLSSGEGFSAPFLNTEGPTAWLMPLYPWLLSCIFNFFGLFSLSSATVVLGVDIVLSSLTVVPLYYLATNCFGRIVALLSAVLFVFYPPSIWHAINFVWDTTLVTFLLVNILYLLYEYSDDATFFDGVKLGLLMGIAALVNAVVLIFYPFATLWFLHRLQLSFAAKSKLFFLLSGIVILLLVPWVSRNYYVFERPILRSNFGVELWLGNNEQIYDKFSQGHYESFLKLHPTINKEEFDKFIELGEIAYADSKLAQAKNFISGNLDKFLYLTKVKISQYWLGSMWQSSEWTGSLVINFSVAGFKMACHLLPFPFFLVGLIVSLKNGNSILLIGYLFFIPIVYYLTHVSERYRFPVEPIILIFACYGFCATVGCMKRFISSAWPYGKVIR